MSNNINIEIGKRIFAARKKLKLSRVELGKKVNLHESTIKRYEDGQIKTLDIEKMKEFANALDIDVVDLLGWNGKFINNIESHAINCKSNSSSDILLRKFISIPKSGKSDPILKLFDKLNSEGKKEAIKRIEELTYIPKYTAHDDIETIAAHNDYLDKDDELDKIKADIEDMKNW